jgi:hypothetical protein
MEPVRPDYGGAWTGGVMPGLLGAARPGWLPPPVADAAVVVVLVLDGLGWSTVTAHRECLPELSAMAGGPITTAVPSTTAACLTSIVTGLPPGEHGLVGYRMKLAGSVLNVLQWRTDGDVDRPDPEVLQPVRPFQGRRVPVVSRAEFARTGFTKAHLRGSRYIGWRTEATMVEHCRQAVCAGERVVYAYADGIDKVAHAHGLQDGFFAAELRSADRLVGQLRDVLPAEAVLLVTADHGQVHVGPEGMVRLDPLHRLVAAFSGEGRFRSLHARAGVSRSLAEAAAEHVGDKAWVFTRERLIDEGWLGPTVRMEVAGRLGDVVLAARAPVAFIDPRQPQELGLISCHGSLTPDEMLVPLLAAPGRG